MSRRRPVLVAAALATALAAVLLAVEDASPLGPRARKGGVPEPEADTCTSERDHLHLELARELGPPARPTLSRPRAERPRSLLLRMDRVADNIFSQAHAATPAASASAAGAEAAGASQTSPAVASAPATSSAPATTPSEATPPAEPARPPEPSAPGPAPAPRRAESKGPVRIDLLSRPRDLGEPAEDSGVFAPKSWVVVVPPPPPPPPPPPEPPRAPPLPFRFAGTLDDGAGRVSFFLLRGNAMLTVVVGDTIDNTYKLDSADGGVLSFTFLPLRERQQLPYGAPQ